MLRQPAGQAPLARALAPSRSLRLCAPRRVGVLPLRRRCASSSSEQQQQPEDAPGPPTASAAPPPSPGLALKALWLAAEQFGVLVGLAKPPLAVAAPVEGPMLAPDERTALLRADYAVDYFVSGRGELRAYADDCEFSDPFVAFRGKRRFLQNVSNLGGLMRDIRLTVTSWDETAADLRTNWRFSCVLALPWRPRLAAAGGTTHVFGHDGRVVRHIERWDIEPAVVVRQLFTPGRGG